jgi:hypothetical protein
LKKSQAVPFFFVGKSCEIHEIVKTKVQTSENRDQKGRGSQIVSCQFLTLAGFEPTICFVDHVNAAFATHNTAITVPVLERAERVFDFHNKSSFLIWRGPAPGVAGVPENRNSEFMVGTTRFELVTPSMSTKCSTAELSAHEYQFETMCPKKMGRRIPRR